MDGKEFKEGQRKSWNSAAKGWKKWWSLLEKFSAPASKKLIEFAGIKSGDRVLDLATGIGEPSISISKVVGTSGSVVATDISEEMLEIARERAQSEGVSNIEFKKMDMEEAEFGTDSNSNGEFDAVTSRWGLMFLPSPEEAVKKMYKALKDGGRVSAAVWSTSEEVPFASRPVMALTKELNLTPPPPGTPGIFALSDKERLTKMFTDAGFKDVSIEPLTLDFIYVSKEEYRDSMRDLAAPIVAIVESQPEGDHERLWQVVADSVDDLVGEGGSVVAPSVTLCVSGVK